MGGETVPDPYPVNAVLEFKTDEYDKGDQIELTFSITNLDTTFEIEPTNVYFYIKNTMFIENPTVQYTHFEGWIQYSLSSSRFHGMETYDLALNWNILLYDLAADLFIQKGRFAFNVGAYELLEFKLEGNIYLASTGGYYGNFETEFLTPSSFHQTEVTIVQGAVKQCFIYNLYDTRWKSAFDGLQPSAFFPIINSVFKNQFSLTFSVYDE